MVRVNLLCMCVYRIVFFFKQKTAYEMRISDWSSDVCSSDLLVRIMADDLPILAGTRLRFIGVDDEEAWTTILAFLRHEGPFESGGESCSSTPAQAGCLAFFHDSVLA